MFSLLLGTLCALAPTVLGRPSTNIRRAALDTFPSSRLTTTYSMNVTDCPGQARAMCWESMLMMAILGYTLGSLQESDIGLTAQLTLAGQACNAFGLDISDLTIEVTYQSQSTYISPNSYRVYNSTNL